MKNNAKMPSDKLCIVCGDKALGYNFNAVTCESCKAFFRRNALSSKGFTCPFSQNCEITVVKRRFCQKCRLDKCFSVGMRKEYIMSEEEKVLHRKKIEQNRVKRQNGSSAGHTPSKLKREEEKLSIDEWSESRDNSSDRVMNEMSSSDPNNSPIASPERVQTSPNTLGIKEEIMSSKPQPFNDLQPTTLQSPISKSPQSLPNSNSSANEIVSHLVDYTEDSSKLINHLMKTPSAAVEIMEKIINSQKEAMRLIAHLIGSPGDALKIISKIMNSPFDALTVFTKFMSSPTDALEIIGKIANSPSEVLQFIKQLMNSPEDALQIMNKFMNSPAEALKMLNKMVNDPKDSTSSTVKELPTSTPCPTGNVTLKSILDTNHNEQCPTSSVNIQTDCCLSNCRPVCPTQCATVMGNQRLNADNEINSSVEIIVNILDDVNHVCSVPTLPDSLDSVLCEAIRLEYGTQSNKYSRDLNDAERAKLNELIVANKALYAPLDDEMSELTYEEDIPRSHDPQILNLLNLTAVAIRRLIKMAKKINAFRNMCQEDQVALLKGGCTEMMIIRAVMQYDGDRATWTIPHSQEEMSQIRVDVLKLAKNNIYEEHERFIRTFDMKWRKDENIILILLAILLFTPTRPKLVHSDVLRLEQNSYYYLLRRYLESVYEGCEAKSTFLKLIQKINELQRLNEALIGIYLDTNPADVEPLLSEIFDLKPR